MKKINFLKLGTLSALAVVFFTMNSNDNGKNAVSTTGCGGCHGGIAATDVTINITGLPANGYIAGTSYNLVATVAHGTFPQAGLDLKTSAGTITPGVGTKLKVGDLVHSAPMSMVAGVASFPFTWVAPAKNTGNVTINIAGMAVNGDGQETAADKWALFSKVVSETFPASVSSTSIQKIEIYPNPCTNTLIVRNVNSSSTVKVSNLQGAVLPVNAQIINGNILHANVANLTVGSYVVTVTNDKEVFTQKIVKQ